MKELKRLKEENKNMRIALKEIETDIQRYKNEELFYLKLMRINADELDRHKRIIKCKDSIIRELKALDIRNRKEMDNVIYERDSITRGFILCVVVFIITIIANLI